MEPAMTRRDFHRNLMAWGLSLGLTPLLIDLLAGEAKAGVWGDGSAVESGFYRRLGGGRVKCEVCPFNCELEEGQTCICRTRTNRGGVLYNDAWRYPSVMSLDPIEKAPLYHYLPGTLSLALSTAGCNLRCQYCQNWDVSQKEPRQVRRLDVTRDEAIAGAQRKRCRSLTFTYAEPVAYYEYLLAVAAAARDAGLRNVVSTAAFINPKPLRMLTRRVDAYAAGLKGFHEPFYQKVCGASLRPVLQALEVMKEEGAWVEVVNLVVPGLNDDPARLRAMARWVSRRLGDETPLHFSRFEPAWRLRHYRRTPVATLARARQIAQDEGLKYVYLSNMPGHEGNNTYCPGCSRTLVERLGFKVLANRIAHGRCPWCQERIAGVWV